MKHFNGYFKSLKYSRKLHDLQAITDIHKNMCTQSHCNDCIIKIAVDAVFTILQGTKDYSSTPPIQVTRIHKQVPPYREG